MKKLIIHVGCGKAGSTSIQRALLECREVNKNLFNYPVIPNSPGNQILRFAFCDVSDTPLNVKQMFSGEDKKEAYKAYQEEIKNAFIKEISDATTVVLSSEFWFISSEEEILNFKAFVNRLGFWDIHIFMYLRDPAKYYLSVAQQALKNQAKLPSPVSFRYKMSEAISNWKLMNPNSFIIREFEREKLIGHDVVTDFKSYLDGLGISSELKLRRSLNETLTSEATQVLQDCFSYVSSNKISDKNYNYFKDLTRKIIKNNNQEGSKPILRKEISTFVYSKYIDELVMLNKEFGLFEGIIDKPNIDFFGINVYPNSFKDIVENFDETIYEKLRESIFNSACFNI